MDTMIFIEVSDRAQMEKQPGLHVRILLKKRSNDLTVELVGTATLTDEVEIGHITISDDAVGVGNEIATALVRAACHSCWNAVVTNGAVMAGIKWRPFIPWLAEQVDVDRLPILTCRVEAAVAAMESP